MLALRIQGVGQYWDRIVLGQGRIAFLLLGVGRRNEVGKNQRGRVGEENRGRVEMVVVLLIGGRRNSWSFNRGRVGLLLMILIGGRVGLLSILFNRGQVGMELLLGVGQTNYNRGRVAVSTIRGRLLWQSLCRVAGLVAVSRGLGCDKILKGCQKFFGDRGIAIDDRWRRVMAQMEIDLSAFTQLSSTQPISEIDRTHIRN